VQAWVTLCEPGPTAVKRTSGIRGSSGIHQGSSGGQGCRTLASVAQSQARGPVAQTVPYTSLNLAWGPYEGRVLPCGFPSASPRTQTYGEESHHRQPDPWGGSGRARDKAAAQDGHFERAKREARGRAVLSAPVRGARFVTDTVLSTSS
jgi:hypothetical protein